MRFVMVMCVRFDGANHSHDFMVMFVCEIRRCGPLS